MAVKDKDGEVFGEALMTSGYLGDKKNRLSPKDQIAYLELHIEQGPVLEDEHKEIGVVEGVVGVVNYEIEISGQPDHAGTTPMKKRKDAFLATFRKIILCYHQGNTINSFGKEARPMTAKTKGYLMLAMATIFWGLSGALSKYFFNQALSPLALAMTRLTLSGLLLLLIISIWRPSMLRLQRADIWKMVIFGMAGMGCVQFFYLYAISKLNVATAVFLEYLSPAIITAYVWWWKKDKLGRFGLPALLLAIGGSALIVTDQAVAGLNRHWAGLLSGFAAAVAMTVYMLVGKRLLERYNTWLVLCYGMLIGAVPFWCLVPPWVIYNAHYSWHTWLFFAYYAVFGTLIPFGLVFMGLRYIEPGPASIAMMLEPVMAGVFAYLLLGEMLSDMQLVGCGLILAAVVALNLEQNPCDSHAKSTSQSQ